MAPLCLSLQIGEVFLDLIAYASGKKQPERGEEAGGKRPGNT
jgi:hypothetical protein